VIQTHVKQSLGFGGGFDRKVKLLELEAGVALRRRWSASG